VADDYYGPYRSRHYPLIQAAADGRAAIVDLLLKWGASPDVAGDPRNSGNSQLTPLDAAAQRGHFEICKRLLSAGADPNHQSFSQETALHFAFSDFYGFHTNQSEIAGLLLDYGANPFCEAGYYKRTPIELDINKGDGELVARMLGQDSQHPLGAKARRKSTHSTKNNRNQTGREKVLAQHGVQWLTLAAQRGEFEAVQALLGAGVNIQSANTNCPTILQSYSLAANDTARSLPGAIQQWHQAQEQLKADYIPKADPNFVASLRIQEARLANKVEMMSPDRWRKVLDALVQHGANYDAFAATALDDTNQVRHLLARDPNVVLTRDCNDQTLLHWSVLTEHLPMLSFWITAGVSLNATNSAGQTALYVAAARGKTEFVRALLAARASTAIRDTNGLTALAVASQNKQADCIHLLLQQTPGSHAERGLSQSLHQAAATGNIAALAALLETQTNLEARNELGLTPLEVAVQSGHLAAAALLVDKGANINARDPDGNTMFQQILLQDRFTVYDRPPANWLNALPDGANKQTFVQNLTVGQNEQGPNPILQGASFLLACGTDAKATNHAGQTAMQLVTEGKTSRSVFFFDDDQEKLLKLLSGAGSNPDERDANGNTALHQLCTGYYDIGKVDRMTSLIAAGADVNATNNLGQTPLHLASEKIGLWDNNDPPVNAPFQLLIYSKANVNAQDDEGLTPLDVLAAADTSFKSEATRALLDAGADPNIKDKHGRTAAHWFLSGKWPWEDAGACLDMLAKAGANLNAKDNDGKTPLHYLAGLGSQSPMFFIRGIDHIFVTAKVDFNARDNDGDTPLHIAAKTGTRDVFDWLVKQGSDLDATNNAGETPRLLMAHSHAAGLPFGPGTADTDIFQAVRKGNIPATEKLLKADPSLASQTNRFNQTPLRLAVMLHRTNMANLLESHGATWDAGSAAMAGRVDVLENLIKHDPSAAGTKVLGKTLLHIAAADNDLKMVNWLMKAGCDLNSRDNWGLTPLGYALIGNFTEVQKALSQHGAKENLFDAIYADDLKTATTLLEADNSLLEIKSENRFSVVDIAAATGHASLLKLLIKRGANLDETEHNPAAFAAYYDQPASLATLIRAGVKLNQLDRLGLAPLHWAAIAGSTNTAVLLLRHKADVNLAITEGAADKRVMMPLNRGILGDTPLHLAALCGNTNMIQLLLKSKADVNAINAMRLTPLDLAGSMRPPFVSLGFILFEMRGLVEPLQTHQDLKNPIQPAMNGRRAAVEMLQKAGGKHSANPAPYFR
jgi:ankyrin repeat protein